MRNGTITISNIGSVGGGWFTPVINYPEVAILGVGTIAQQPIVNGEGGNRRRSSNETFSEFRSPDR